MTSGTCSDRISARRSDAINLNQLNTPVAFIVFNRPEPTRRVFAAIAAARPTHLFIVADAPRADRRANSSAVNRS